MILALLRTPALRRPFALLLAALLLGGSAFHLSLSHRVASEMTLHRQTAATNAAAQDARLAPTRLRDDRGAVEVYRQMEQRGFSAPENRVGWISALSRAQTQLDVDSLSWRLGPREPSTIAPGLGHTPMDITLQRVSIDRLEAMLALLADIAPGHYTIEHCAIALQGDGSSGQADCRLHWWTLLEQAGPP